MPPKRKRAETTTESSTTRSTKRSTRTTRAKEGADDVNEKANVSNSVEAPSGKTKAARGKRGSTASSARKTNSKRVASVTGIDDGPLDSTTTQQQSDDELDMAKKSPSAAAPMEEYSQRRAQALFNRFADDDDPDVIGPAGIERLCTEAGIPLEGAQTLILAWQFEAEEMAKLSRSEWLRGSETLRISSLPILAMALKDLDDLVIHDKDPVTSSFQASPSLKKRDGVNVKEAYNRTRYQQSILNRHAAFTELYHFCFTLSKPSQSRNLDIETAMALWSVLLTPRYPIAAELNEFLSESGSYKGANKDIWNMVHEFCRTVNAELTNYEADGAWPTMLDDFVEWKKGKMACSTDVTPMPKDERIH